MVFFRFENAMIGNREDVVVLLRYFEYLFNLFN